MRKSYDEIKKIANQLDCEDIFSWSKINTYLTDTYEYYLKYVVRIPEDRKDSMYPVMGGTAHDILENFYSNKIKHEDMVNIFEEKLFEYTIADLKYNRNDTEKNNKIANKYEACLRHFFRNHQKIKGKTKLEMFVPLKINNIMIQTYIDFMSQDENKLYITDWKTSTIYKGEKAESEKWQLVIYALAIYKKLNIPLDKIVIRWGFLKYVNVDCLQANKKWKTRTIERNNIGNSLISSIKMWLKKSENKLTEDEIEKYVLQVITDNSIECLPEDVKDKFLINDCYVEIPLNEDILNELENMIINIVSEIKEKEEKYKNEKDHKIWWQDVDEKRDSFRLNVLGGYSAKLHKPYKEYLDKIEMFKTNKESNNDVDDNDISWLEDLLD